MANYSTEQVKKYLDVYERLSEFNLHRDGLLLGAGILAESIDSREAKRIYEEAKELPEELQSGDFRKKLSTLERFLEGMKLVSK